MVFKLTIVPKSVVITSNGENSALKFQFQLIHFRVGMVEVNDLYNSVEAAQICGTPLETEFDNIIYDNIWLQVGEMFNCTAYLETNSWTNTNYI